MSESIGQYKNTKNYDMYLATVRINLYLPTVQIFQYMPSLLKREPLHSIKNIQATDSYHDKSFK